MITKLLSILFFLSPFIMAYGLYLFLNPAGFWQLGLYLVISLIICIFEGFFAWIIGLALWEY